MNNALLLAALLSAAAVPAKAVEANAEGAAYFRIIDRNLGLGEARKADARDAAERAANDLAALLPEENELRARNKALNDDLFVRLTGLLDDEHKRLVDPTASVYNMDADFLPPLPAALKERGRKIYEEARPESQRLKEALASLRRRRAARWAKFLAEVRALDASAPAVKVEAAVAALDERRTARELRDDLVFLADDPAVLGAAQERVRLVEKARAELVAPWMSAWRAKDMGAFARLTTADFTATSLDAPALKRSGTVAKEYGFPGAKTLARDAALKSLKSFVDRYASVDGCDLELFGVDSGRGGLVFKGLLSVRGPGREDRRRMESVSAVKVSVAEDGGAYAIRGLELVEPKMIVAVKDAAFENRTEAAGLKGVPVHLRSESIRRGGYALALNAGNAGPAEMYVGTVGSGVLLRQTPGGRFRDETPSSGLGDDRLVKSAIFADFNDDGISDLLVNHFQDSPDKALSLYEGTGAAYRPAADFNFSRIAANRYKYPMTMAVGDFNGDRKLDMYVGFPGTMDFTTMRYEASLTPETAARPQGLFLNDGGFKFSDRTKYGLYDDKDYNWTLSFPHASVAADLDGDGRTDVIVVDDRKNPSTIYRNKGDGAFEEVAQKFGVWNAHWGMSAAVGDYKNGGSQDIFMTNVNFPTSFVMQNEAGWLFGEKSASANSLGNHLYRNRGDGTFVDATDEAGLRWAGTAPACAQSLDFDNDGHLDIYAANGLWSSGPQAKPLDSTFLLASMAEKNLRTAGRLFGLKDFGLCHACAEHALMSFSAEGKQKNAVLMVLRGYLGDDGLPAYSLGGDQRNRLFHNNGDGTFTDLAYVAGVDSIADGYVSAVADFDHDGAVDLVLRNGDPGTTAYSYPTVELFVNNAGKDRSYLTFRLTGKGGNRDAIGAKVFVERKSGPRQYRELIANNGAAQDAKLVHFGLGEDAGATKVLVRWPGGAEQSFENLAGGNYELLEGGAPQRIDPDESFKIGAR